ncbi:MAG: Hpt domain-containing protein [Gammaproteobacteria bacterium]
MMTKARPIEAFDGSHSVWPAAENRGHHCTGPEHDIWDTQEALQRVDGDRPFLREIVQLFLEYSRELLANLETGLEAKDAAAVRLAAHALKGSAAELSAWEVLREARRLEEVAQGGDLSMLGIHGQRLQRAVSRLANTLRAWLGSGTS